MNIQKIVFKSGRQALTIAAALVCFAAVPAAQAGTAKLVDWCVNLNGDTTTACNGAGNGNASIVLSGTTPGTYTLGVDSLASASITLGPGNAQFAAFYVDYDVDFASFGSFDDFATTGGALPAGWSWEAADPNTSLIFSDLQSFNGVTPLPDTNTVATGGLPPSDCCDVSLALGVSGINIAAGGSGTVTFSVTNAVPTSGFYLKQTNFTNQGDSIYLTATVNTNGGGGGPMVPEPSTFMLGLGCIGSVLAWKRARKV